MDTYRIRIQSAEEDLRISQEMYNLGSVSLLEVLTAQAALTGAQGNSVTTKYNAKIAEAQLNLLCGYSHIRRS